MGLLSKDLTDHHNDGQRDAADGKESSPPNAGLIGTFVGSLSSDIRDLNQAEDRAYQAGYDNASKQK
jgi:hypothetical protein